MQDRFFFPSVWQGETGNKHRSSAQAPPGIEGLGLSKEETRIVLANTMHFHASANFVPSVLHLQYSLTGCCMASAAS